MRAHPSGRPLRRYERPRPLSIPRRPRDEYLTPGMNITMTDAIGFLAGGDFTVSDNEDEFEEDKRNSVRKMGQSSDIR